MIGFLPALFSLFLSIGTKTFFHACEIRDDGTWMHCHTAENAVIIGGVLLMLLSITAACIQNKRISIILNILCAAGAVAVFLIPGVLVSMCMIQTMRCYAVMQPFVRILSALIIVFSLFPVLRNAGK